jgi:hypothetical protein
MRPDQQQDPYAPPPRHRERSGALVRFAIIAALMGAAAWGYMEYSQQPQTALVDPAAQEQSLADTTYDATPTAGPNMVEDAPQSTTPAETPEPAPDRPPA